MLGGELRHEVRRQCRRVGERLVEGLRERGQEHGRIGMDEQLVVVRAVALGDEACVGALVEAALLEADRERVNRVRALLRRERGEHRRVDAAGEHDADRYVGEQVRTHRVAQPRAQLLDQLRLVVGAQLLDGHRAGTRVAVDVHGSVLLPDEHVTGGKLADLAEDRVRRRDRVEREERLERVEVDLAARERAQLGGELEHAADVAVVERLDPVPVAREHEPSSPCVPDRDGEHAAQPAHEVRAVLLVEVEVHLRVAVVVRKVWPSRSSSRRNSGKL